jgi:hypothetical protein
MYVLYTKKEYRLVNVRILDWLVMSPLTILLLYVGIPTVLSLYVHAGQTIGGCIEKWRSECEYNDASMCKHHQVSTVPVNTILEYMSYVTT